MTIEHIRQHAAEQFIADDAECIDIGGDTHGGAGELLGGGVFRRDRMAFSDRARARIVIVIGQQAGNTEVEQAHGAAGVDQHIARFQVAMYHQLRVRILRGRADIDQQFDAGTQIQSLAVAPGVDGHAVDEFEGEPWASIGRHTGIDEAGEVGMRQPRKDASLAQKACLHIIEIKAATDQLDGDFLRIIGVDAGAAIDHAHAATTDAFEHLK